MRCYSKFLFDCFLSICLSVCVGSWNYRGIKIQMTDKELLINYGFFNRKRIPTSNIVSCEHTQAPLWKYGGVGIRYCLTDGSCACVTSFGDAVKTVRRKGRSFVFSSNNPEKLCSIVNQIKARATGL